MGMAATVQRYTIDDLEHFPDDGNRYELLDGVLLVTPSPGFPHQRIATQLAALLYNYAQAGGHALVVAPGAVVLPPGTQLEPDILVVPPHVPVDATWEMISEHWLAVEVLSRSTRVRDRDLKRDEYLKLNVQEVWLVDPCTNTVDVTREVGKIETVSDVLRWRVRGREDELQIDLPALFAGRV